MSPEKQSILDTVCQQINKEYGQGTVTKLTTEVKPTLDDVISSGSISLDSALGIGGYKKGRIIEIYGPESGGKTTACLHAMANNQKAGYPGLYIDAEHSLDDQYAQNLGIDLDKMYIAQPDYGEQGLNIALSFAKSGEVGLIVIDSVAALVPKSELEGDVGDSVSYDTPVFIRNKSDKFIDIVPISELYGGHKEFTKGHHTQWYRKNRRKEILTHEGWKNILGVVKKENIKQKPLIGTRTSTGYVKTTEDHSLFVNNEEKSPKELEIFDRVDIYNKKIESLRLLYYNEDLAWLIGFWVAEGSSPRSENSNRFEVCNTNKSLILICKAIVEKYFTCKTEIRRENNKGKGNRKDLFILTCSAEANLGQIMRESFCPKTKYLSKGSQRPFLKKVPKQILNASREAKEAFLNGFWAGDGSSKGKTKGSRFYHNNSLPVIAGIQYLNTCLGIRTNTVIHPERPESVTLSENHIITRKENEILQFYKESPPEFLWDISTESGTFVTAIGNIICHNSSIGTQARMMGQALRKLVGVCNKNETTIIFVNQIRYKIGVLFGSPETTTGGNALKFYASQRLDIRRIADIKRNEEIIGSRTKVKVTKNKVAPPKKIAEFEIKYGIGIDSDGELIDLAAEDGVIKKSGAWYKYGEDSIAQGRQNAILWLNDNPEIKETIRQEVLANRGLDSNEQGTE